VSESNGFPLEEALWELVVLAETAFGSRTTIALELIVICVPRFVPSTTAETKYVPPPGRFGKTTPPLEPVVSCSTAPVLDVRATAVPGTGAP
jgi:hypothetical protein